MAGIFGFFDYTKEGKGVYANGPTLGPVKSFLSILGRKFWKTITVNILYFLLSIPFLVLAVIIGTYAFPMLFPFLRLEELEKVISSMASSSALPQVTDALSAKDTASALFFQMAIVFSMGLVGMQLIVFGPVQAGITYLFRNFAKEEPVFIWFDFKEHAKENWKQSLVTSLISIGVFIILCYNITFYANGQLFSNKILNGVLTGLFIVMLILFTIMQMYIYPMMVTFKLTIRQIYRNAFLLTAAKLLTNLGVFALALLISLVIPLISILFLGGIGIVLCIFYYLFIGFGVTLLLTNFQAYRQLKKYMIDPALREEEKKKDEEGIDSEKKEKPIFRESNPKVN